MTNSLLFSMLMKMDAGQAKTELRALSTETRKAKGEAADLGSSGRAAGAGVTHLSGASQAAAAGVSALSAAEARSTVTAGQMRAAHHGAAGSVGNLVAQFNDIGMMLAAGQNPLQLALQQGTQITQVIGPMGAGGAVRALGAAFMGMLNPVSLVTIGSIAAGAAMIQWLTSTGDAAATLEEALDGLTDSLDAYREAADPAMHSSEFLLKTFGALTPEVFRLQRQVQELRLREVLLDAADAAHKLATAFDYDGFLTTGALDLQHLFDLNLGQGHQMLYLFRQIGEAASLDEQLLAIESLKVSILNATGGIGGMTAEQAAFYGKVLDSEAALRRAEAVAKGLAGVDMATGLNSAAAAAKGIADELTRAVSAAQSLSAQGISSLRESALRLEMKDQPVALAGALAREEFDRRTPVPQGADSTVLAVLEGQRRAHVATAIATEENRQALLAWQKAQSKLASAAGSGAKATQAERDAVAELIAKLREERQVQLELDPAKAELLKYRKQLAGATAEERAEVEELIRAEIKLNSVREFADFFGTSTLDALKGIAQGGDAATQAVRKLANAFLDAALQAMWLGTGPLASVLGVSGGIFSSIGSALFGTGAVAKADGGMIFGPGGPRDDRVPIWGSAGEFMVNAPATARYRPLLELINSGGAVPGYANGGPIGGVPRPGRAGAAGGTRSADVMEVHIHGATGNAEIKEMVGQGVAQGLRLFDREVLPGRVTTIFKQGGKVTG